MKKRSCLLILALAGVSALSIAGFAGCNGGSHGADEARTGTYRGIGSTESVYGVAAVTTAKLLKSESAEVASLAAPADTGTADTGTAGADKAQAELDDFNKYFNMLDTFLDKSATKTVVTKNSSSDEALAGYEFKLIITGKNAAGEDVPHTVYFTETAGASKTDAHTDRDGETETTVTKTYTLDGVVEMGTDETGAAIYYYMSGARTELEITETEGRETETEYISSLTMKASVQKDDPLNYVSLTHTQSSETEADETETESLYTYTVFENGIPVESTAVGFEEETEKGETETEYTVAFQSGTSRGIYTIERETKGNAAEIVVEYLMDGTAGSFTVSKNADGTYRYHFAETSADRFLDDFFD